MKDFPFKMGIYLVISLIFCSSINQNIKWRPEILFIQDGIEHNRMATEVSLCVFPIIMQTGAFNDSIIKPEYLRKIIKKSTDINHIYTKKNFEERFFQTFSQNDLSTFYTALIKNDYIFLANFRKAWMSLPTQMALFIRIKNGITVKTFNGVSLKKLEVFGEIWHRERGEVIWRGRVYGKMINPEITDRVFIKQGVEKFCLLLPQFLPATHNKNW